MWNVVTVADCKLQEELNKLEADGYDIVLIEPRGHDPALGTSKTMVISKKAYVVVQETSEPDFAEKTPEVDITGKVWSRLLQRWIDPPGME